MVKLETLQKYAERIATKLKTDVKPIVVWGKGKGAASIQLCNRVNQQEEVVHPRGEIMFFKSDFKDARGWRWIIAHEVCHLKVKSHFSPYFSRYMAQLGFNQMGEKQEAIKAGLLRCHHDWRQNYLISDGMEGRQWVIRYSLRCRICGKEREK